MNNIESIKRALTAVKNKHGVPFFASDKIFEEQKPKKYILYEIKNSDITVSLFYSYSEDHGNLIDSIVCEMNLNGFGVLNYKSVDYDREIERFAVNIDFTANLSWTDATEMALKDIKQQTGIPFDFQRFDNGIALPDAYIVYFLISKPPELFVDGQEKSSTAKIQISFYYRTKKDILTMPKIIAEAMRSKGFGRGADGNLPFDTKTGHYGYRMEFYYYERR